MSTAPGGASRAAPSRAGRARSRDRSSAQWYCLIVGATLLLVGALGFLAEAKFDTSSGGDPGSVDGEDFLIFEVNGWHNVVHILSGAFLLLMSSRHARARTGTLVFGAIYGLVAVIGLIDGHDVFGIIPIDPADNVLHVLLAGSALAVGLISDRDPRPERGDATHTRFDRRATTTTRRARASTKKGAL
ncbi:MAG TPA: DUF4383 domain-containing protein [Thermoleophilaceae bacterium]